MGHRLKLSENIVRALKRMKCPHPIDPHQIQVNSLKLSFFNFLFLIDSSSS